MPEKQFLQLGFNNNEKEVYLAVLRAGKIPVHRVASLTSINRTTVYSIAKKLSDLGLISEDKGQKVSYLVAEPPEKLLAIIEKEENEIQEKKLSVNVLITELSAIKSEKQYSVPRIKFIEETDLSEYLYGQSKTWSDSLNKYDSTWWGYHDSSATTAYGDWINWCWKQPFSQSVKVKFFSNNNEVEGQMNELHSNRLTKPLPTGTEFDSSLWIVGDYVLMVQTRMRPHYLVEIHDEVLARNQRALFKGLWSLAK